MKLKFLITILITFLLFGCKDKYQEGYSIGYSDGVRSMESKLKECEDKLEEQKRKSNYSYGVTSTEVCGGGVNLNGKYYSGGKTGCVRVYSDGRVEKY